MVSAECRVRKKTSWAMNYWKEVIRHQLKELPSKTDAFAAIIHGERAIKGNGT